MKNKFLKILAVVLIVAMLSTFFVACKKDDEEAKASNSETLGTTAAVMANALTGDAIASAVAAAAEDPVEEGINIDFGAGIGVTGIGTAVNTLVTPVLEKVVAASVDSVEGIVNESGVKVEKAAASDNAEFDVLYNITITHYDDELEKDVVDAFKLYIDADGADIDGTKDYHFTAQIAAVTGEGTEATTTALLTFEGDCKYDEALKGMKFVFDVNVTGLAGLELSAYAGANGIVIEVGASVLSADVDVKLEIGKLADNKYGVNVNAAVGIAGYSVKANVSVTAEKVTKTVEEAEVTIHQFVINGSLEIQTAEILSKVYKVTANLTGTASYETEADELKLYITGDASITETQVEAA